MNLKTRGKTLKSCKGTMIFLREIMFARGLENNRTRFFSYMLRIALPYGNHAKARVSDYESIFRGVIRPPL